MNKPRDFQRSKVYDAEVSLRGNGRQFADLDEVKVYVKKLTGSAWFNRRRRDDRRINVIGGQNRNFARAYGGHTIKIPPWAQNEIVVLHELAHILVNSNTTMMSGERESSHGREFCRAFLSLIYHKMGLSVYNNFKESFKKYRVRHVRTKDSRRAY